MRYNSKVEERLGPYTRDRGEPCWLSNERKVVVGTVRLIDGVLMACSSNDCCFGSYLTFWWPVAQLTAKATPEAAK